MFTFIGLLQFFSLQTFAATSLQMSSFKRHHFLVLVYSAHCKFCQRFIPIVKNFEIKNRWPGVAFTADTASPLWPDVERLNSRLKYAWFGNHVQVPALFLYSDDGTISLISLGYLNQASLEQRLKVFITRVIKREAKSA